MLEKSKMQDDGSNSIDWAENERGASTRQLGVASPAGTSFCCSRKLVVFQSVRNGLRCSEVCMVQACMVFYCKLPQRFVD